MARNRGVSVRSKAGNEAAQNGLRDIRGRFNIDDSAWAEACTLLRFAVYRTDALIAAEGQILKKYFLVLSGTVRYEKTASNGRQLYICRVSSGQSCGVTTTSLINETPLLANAVAETDVVVGVMAKRDFFRCLNDSPGFRRYVFSGCSEQLKSVVGLVKDLTFHRVDQRLAQWLLSRDQCVIRATHQDLANELGSAREVISRTIKCFRQRGWVDVRRGTLEVIDRDALSALLPTDDV